MSMDTLYQQIADKIRRKPLEDSFLTDPAAWAMDKLKAFLWSKQVEICASVIANRRTAVRSGHGIGKSWTAGMLAAWWIDTHPVGEAIVITTAPTYPQVHAILWEEIRKQHRTGDLAGTVLQTDVWNIDGVLVGMGRKPSDYSDSAFQGIHRRYVLVILDEACGVATGLWTGAEAITTNADCRIVAIGNPDNPSSEFYNACKPGSDFNVIGVSSYDSPNLTGEDVPDELRPLLVDEDWIKGREKRWGKDSPLFQSKVLGLFPKTSVDTLIPIEWIERAQQKTLPVDGWPRTLGVDVARFGTDHSVIITRAGGRFRIYSDRNGERTTVTAGRAVEAWMSTSAEDIRVDGVGVGAGVVDILDEDGYPVEDIQSGAEPNDKKHFINLRAEAYWSLREMFERDEVDLDPDDDELASQLGSIKYIFTRKGKIQIESKDDMRKRGMPSPDLADGCMLAVAEPVDGNRTSSVASD